jgi:hypothetical protein
MCVRLRESEKDINIYIEREKEREHSLICSSCEDKYKWSKNVLFLKLKFLPNMLT